MTLLLGDRKGKVGYEVVLKHDITVKCLLFVFLPMQWSVIMIVRKVIYISILTFF
jgi:hypothetical protein